MSKTEGVIKFRLEYTPSPALDAAEVADLSHWRDVLYRHALIGADPARYGGYGFGNLSRRIAPLDAPPNHRAFLISGTQTGELAWLTGDHYAVVTACFPDENRCVAHGPIRPSSESLTHGTVYDLDAAVQWVLHAHSPAIWRAAARLALPTTRADVPYGTPEMAQEVRRLFAESDVAVRRIFSMGGHEDGIVSFGATAQEAADVLLATLRRAEGS
jgi:ribulose-5-phosphate 4-epimerase/fuculose-1-phosphate aldolase